METTTEKEDKVLQQTTKEEQGKQLGTKAVVMPLSCCELKNAKALKPKTSDEDFEKHGYTTMLFEGDIASVVLLHKLFEDSVYTDTKIQPIDSVMLVYTHDPMSCDFKTLSWSLDNTISYIESVYGGSGNKIEIKPILYKLQNLPVPIIDDDVGISKKDLNRSKLFGGIKIYSKVVRFVKLFTVVNYVLNTTPYTNNRIIVPWYTGDESASDIFDKLFNNSDDGNNTQKQDSTGTNNNMVVDDNENTNLLLSTMSSVVKYLTTTTDNNNKEEKEHGILCNDSGNTFTHSCVTTDDNNNTTPNVDIVSPFNGVKFENIVKMGSKLETPMKFGIHCMLPKFQTRKGRERVYHCGVCPLCEYRMEIFQSLGLEDVGVKYLSVVPV